MTNESGRTSDVGAGFKPAPTGVIEEIIERAKQQDRTVLTEIESKEIIKGAGIPVAEAKLATSSVEAINIAREIGYPVVLKVVSPSISHKSDVGGVRLNLTTDGQAATAFEELRTTAADFLGAAVQQMAPQGTEVILGVSTDPQFGPVLMFGLGGVMVEVLKDVAFRLVPLERPDAHDMIREIKSFPLLEGHRGQDAADLAVLEDLILRLSGLAASRPQIAEIDLNPVIVYSKGAIAVDARVVLAE